MNKEETIKTIVEIHKELEKLDDFLAQCKTKFITKKQTKQEIQTISTKWFENLDPTLRQFGISESTKGKYHELFTQLLQLSVKTSWRKTYKKTIAEILANYKDEILVTVMKSAGRIVSISTSANILQNVTPEEREYLNEALGCAQHEFYRASMVIVWSAAIHRMQETVERLGIEEFNKKTEEMKKITEGRFKRFKKSFSIHSLSELRASVFDNDLLWVLEYWDLIDANQHERLSMCFTMRNNAAHPGDAVITEPNLASAFSDLKTIIFDNPKFGVKQSVA
jgi:hypothetical protein